MFSIVTEIIRQRAKRTPHLQTWMPVNIIFVLMLATGIWALQLMGVAMVTIMKNLTNILTISGDYVMYGRTYNAFVWLSLLLITGSALVGAKTDLGFSWWGYTAQLLNCVFTAAYSLVLRGVMDKVSSSLTCSVRMGRCWTPHQLRPSGSSGACA
jgi:GDP-mannose transporter